MYQPTLLGPNYKGIVEKELQMKERLLSTKFNEEKLKLQRHHDDLLQKVNTNPTDGKRS